MSSRKRGKPDGAESGGSPMKKPRTNSARLSPSEKEIDVSGLELVIACCYGTTAEAKRLIAKGAPVDWQNRHGWAPLHEASQWGRTEIVMLLVENKCNLNVTAYYGDTPLILAASWNNMDTVRALVEAGCDITIRGDENKTAAERAKDKGNHAIAEYLATEAPFVRFAPSARDESGQLHRVKGRATRAIKRSN